MLTLMLITSAYLMKITRQITRMLRFLLKLQCTWAYSKIGNFNRMAYFPKNSQ